MPLIRGHHQHDQYAAIPNEWLRDNRLSLKAIGLLAQIHTHQVGWSLSIHGLALANRVSRDQISSAIKELESYGYLTRSQTIDEQSKRFQEATWTTSDPIPKGQKPLPEKPSTEKPLPEKSTAKKTISKENQLKEKQIKKEYSPEFEIFWMTYPRKENKPKAAKEFAKLSDEIDAIMSALTIWMTHPSKLDRQYWPYAERWLRDRRFDDELPSASGLDKSKILGWFE